MRSKSLTQNFNIMSAKKIYSTLALLLGYAIIITCFILFGDSLENNVKILDVVVSCLVYSQVAVFFVFPLINLKKPANKEVGMLGIYLVTFKIYSILAVAWMIIGAAYDIEFKYQLIGHLALLFILLVGRTATARSGEKVEELYNKEHKLTDAKKSLLREMDNFMDDIATVNDLSPTVRQRLESIQESLRYLSPSSDSEAQDCDNQIVQLLGDLRVMMRNISMNSDKITDEVSRLERLVAKRKKY